MWFRNLLIYRITQEIAAFVQGIKAGADDELAEHPLEVALHSKPARPCASQELSTYGFIAPFGKGEDAPLVQVSGDFLLIATRKEERILPGNVVREAVAEKVEQIEADQGRKVYKKERDQIKDEIIQAFLPRAFIRRKATYAAIDTKSGLIYIDAFHPGRAEDLLSTLREVIGSLPVRPITTKLAPASSMTDWLKTQKAADKFFVLDEAKLSDTHEDGGTIAARRQDLTSDEIQLCLISGKVVTQLSMAWEDKLRFVLDDRMTIRRLAFEDLLRDQAEQDGGDDALGQQVASFVLMMLTFREFVPALLEALGGEEIPQGLGEQQPREPLASADEGIDVTKLLGMKDGLTATLHFPGAKQKDSDDDVDPLYAGAVAFVRESRRASVSSLQRKLLIGYNRAARLMETLEAARVVSPMHTDGSREVL